MQTKRPSFVAGMRTAGPGLMRTGSQMFFQVEATNKPLYQRGIFWVYTLMSFAGIAAAAAFIILYFKASADDPAVFSTGTAPPISWGYYTNAQGVEVPCPYGGCTNSPTLDQRFITKSPTTIVQG